MKILIIALFLSITGYSQSVKSDYIFARAEVDPRNLLIGGTTTDAALDFTVTVGRRGESGFQVNFTYEQFKAIQYQSSYFEAGKFWNNGKHLQLGLMTGAGLVWRKNEWAKFLTPTVNLSGIVEYHLNNRLFTSVRLEPRYRGELRKVVFSGYVGIGIKL